MQISLENIFSENNLQWIEVSKLVPGKWQIRSIYNEQESLTESIKQHGILEPLLIQPKPEGYFAIIAGERRFRSAKLLELSSVPCRILKITDSEAAIINIVENVQRMNFAPIEEARGYKALLEQGFTQEKIATSVNKSRSYIANTVRLLNLPEEIQEMLINQEITVSHARNLINKEHNIQKARRIKENQHTIREAFQKDDDICFLEDQLSRSLNMRVEINANKKYAGKFLLYFKNLTEFDSLVEKLTNI